MVRLCFDFLDNDSEETPTVSNGINEILMLGGQAVHNEGRGT